MSRLIRHTNSENKQILKKCDQVIIKNFNLPMTVSFDKVYDSFNLADIQVPEQGETNNVSAHFIRQQVTLALSRLGSLGDPQCQVLDARDDGSLGARRKNLHSSGKINTSRPHQGAGCGGPPESNGSSPSSSRSRDSRRQPPRGPFSNKERSRNLGWQPGGDGGPPYDSDSSGNGDSHGRGRHHTRHQNVSTPVNNSQTPAPAQIPLNLPWLPTLYAEQYKWSGNTRILAHFLRNFKQHFAVYGDVSALAFLKQCITPSYHR